MPKPRIYFLFSVFFYLFFSVSVSKGDENQSLKQIESGQGSAKKYARFISQDAAMKRVLKLSKGTAERKRTEKLLKGLDWDLGDSKIRFYGNPLAGGVGDAVVRFKLPFGLVEGDAITLRYHGRKP